tara:strand:- start:44 stop:280 length:237 start_codon:yes stop_codon:yes gene_type:complete
MSNPFKEGSSVNKVNSRYFTDGIIIQLKKVKVGESLLLDILGKDVGTSRMAIRYCSNKLGFKFATKTNDGNLWVKRIL